MKNKILKAAVFVCAVAMIGTGSFVSVGAKAQSWYCPRAVEHRQPVADEDVRYVEQYGGFYVDKKHGDDSTDKVVYLTFDAGYENGNVSKILDVLKDEQVSGAFFILENLIVRNTELVRRMADEGHLLCNHTCRHKDMTRVSSIEEFSVELENLEKICLERTGKEMTKFYRPPEGRFDRATLEYADRLGYKTIFWSVAYADWDNDAQPSPREALDKLTSKLHNGAVILLHPTSATNAEILSEFIRTLRDDGYRFGSLYELVSAESGQTQ